MADTVNPKTRRVTVRCQVPNPGGRLKPEMYAALTLAAGRAPRGAGACPGGDPGDRGQALVFVKSEGAPSSGATSPSARRAEGWVEVRSGVKAGEEVATTGSFLLKSELLKGSPAEEE